jgi:outer membrane protein assembly factor BamB
MKKVAFCFFTALGIFTSQLANADGYWPQFRGPGGEGHATSSGVPLEWSETKNVTWKTEIPGRGWSSPVIDNGQIWMTTSFVSEATEEEKKRRLAGRPDAKMLAVVGGVTFHAICVDLKSGKLLHNIKLFSTSNPEPIHTLNSYASPTPILADGRLYCHFGEYGTVCIDTTTREVVWNNRELKVDHQNGPGSSPVLWNDLLIVHCDGRDDQYTAALDKNSGELRWKTSRSGKMNERPEFRKAYCTPLVIEADGRPQLISPAADWVYSYDPATGKELWKAGYGKLGFSNVPRPIAGHGMVFICSCFMQSSMYAVRYDGKGDVTDSHIAWKFDSQMPRMPSPILVGDLLYVVSDNGVATCLEAKTGKQVWRSRLGGNYSASPLYVNDRIYFFNREGETIAIKPGREYFELAKSKLDGRYFASAAVVDDALILRTDTHLYRIEE